MEIYSLRSGNIRNLVSTLPEVDELVSQLCARIRATPALEAGASVLSVPLPRANPP